MCLKRLNYDRKELEKRREESQHEIKGKLVRLNGASSESCGGSGLGGAGTCLTDPCLGLSEGRRGILCHREAPNLRGKTQPLGSRELPV